MSEEKTGQRGTAVESRILYEDNHIIAVNKLPSEIVQGDMTGDETLAETVKDYLKRRYGKPGNVFLGIPHRLDRPTSGIVLFAKTGKALTRLSEIFRTRDIQKTYWAVTCSAPPEPQDRLENYLVRNRQKNKSFVVKRPTAKGSKGGNAAKKASLVYKLLGATKNYFLVEIDLETGRHHQIRAQFAELGVFIKGDLKYGAPRSNRGGGIHLHARQVVFNHPIKRESVKITAPPPLDQVWDQFNKLGNN